MIEQAHKKHLASLQQENEQLKDNLKKIQSLIVQTVNDSIQKLSKADEIKTSAELMKQLAKIIHRCAPVDKYKNDMLMIDLPLNQ